MKNFTLLALCIFTVASCSSKKALSNATTGYPSSKPESEINPGQVIQYNPNPENSRLAILHKKLIESESYQTSEKLTDSLIKCMPKKFENWDLVGDNPEFKTWLEENIASTKFENYENFRQLYSIMTKAVALNNEENAEFYEVWMNTDPDSWEFDFYAP